MADDSARSSRRRFSAGRQVSSLCPGVGGGSRFAKLGIEAARKFSIGMRFFENFWEFSRVGNLFIHSHGLFDAVPVRKLTIY